MDPDFSSNRCVSPLEEYEVPTRHSELSFEDGNLSIVAGRQYFIVHRGLLCIHSAILQNSIESIKSDDDRLLEGLAVLYLDDSPEDLAHFLRALYGLSYDNITGDFTATSAILRLATKYEVGILREVALRNLSLSWPTALLMWEAREKAATTLDGVYAPRPVLPHPLVLIQLARQVNAPQLLPSAFYDLSRYLPSQLMEGHVSPDGVHYRLDIEDLCRVLRGKEQAARFFSTFIVTELEGRTPSQLCVHRNEVQPSLKRACQMAFEAVTFELIRDVNGMVCNRNSDPLFSIGESMVMQTRDDQPGIENKAAYRACEACRLEYGVIVDVARDEFWRQLPTWFELDVKNWNISDKLPMMMQDIDFEDDLDLQSTMSDGDIPDREGSLSNMIIQEEAWSDIVAEGYDNGQEEDMNASEEDEHDIRDEALNSLENLVLSFLTQLSGVLPSAYSQPQVPKLSERKIILHLANRSKESSDSVIATRTLMFPKSSKGSSARPFAQLFRVVDLVHEAVVNDIPTTKRDMYYKDVQLFRSQATVDKLVDDIAATFQLSRADLNVRASSKGLISGYGLSIRLKSGELIKIGDSEASLIPQAEDIERFEVAEGLAWVLVVEKEAVFQTLCRLRLAIDEALPGPGLIVTGKGYPDVATRQLVKTLADNLPSRIPIMALVDGDAYGIDILSVYKHGSTRMQHESEHLAAARVQWLGLWASELSGLGIDKDALLPITKHDEKKARTLLRRRGLPAQCRKELQYMLFSRRKAEIEVLSAARPPANAIADLGLGLENTQAGDRPTREAAYIGIPLLRYLVGKIRSACRDSDRVKFRSEVGVCGSDR